MTFAMFIVFQKINIKESKLLKNLSSATFGIFLCHFYPGTSFYRRVSSSGISPGNCQNFMYCHRKLFSKLWSNRIAKL
jgi:hypothetical protein